ncbi:MAG: GDYXXLXY domain-containing protein [Bacteroidota bacterium]
MSPKYITFSLFALLALAQIFIPASMIWEQQETITGGQAFKFRTAPVDPSDPFRGKYITLSFDIRRYETVEAKTFQAGEDVYAFLEEDSLGYAQISQISKTPPEDDTPYVQASVRSSYDQWVNLRFPFRKYYMEESKAYEAELAYRQAQREANPETYALVMVKDGNSALEDVVLDGVSIREVVEAVGD